MICMPHARGEGCARSPDVQELPWGVPAAHDPEVGSHREVSSVTFRRFRMWMPSPTTSIFQRSSMGSFGALRRFIWKTIGRWKVLGAR